MYFEKMAEAELAVKAEIACLTLSGHDKLQLTCQSHNLTQLLPSLEPRGFNLVKPSFFNWRLFLALILKLRIKFETNLNPDYRPFLVNISKRAGN